MSGQQSSKFKLDSTKTTATQEAINRTLEIANNYAGELSIEVLPLEKIELDPENKRDMMLTLQDALHGIATTDPDYARKKEDWKSLESLAKTIKEGQLINPIFVYRYGNKCRLIAGERRTLASAIAGKQEIIARIAGQRPLGTKLRVLQWVENHERADLSLAERMASLESIQQAYFAEQNGDKKEKMTAKTLSDLTGMSMTQARRYLVVLHSPEEIKTAVLEGKLENIKLVELICSEKNLEQQKELLNAALLGMSFEAIVQLKKALEENATNHKRIVGKRKRDSDKVNLGSAKPIIIKKIVDALLSSDLLTPPAKEKIDIIKRQADWATTVAPEKIFKDIILVLEEIG